MRKLTPFFTIFFLSCAVLGLTLAVFHGSLMNVSILALIYGSNSIILRDLLFLILGFAVSVSLGKWIFSFITGGGLITYFISEFPHFSRLDYLNNQIIELSFRNPLLNFDVWVFVFWIAGLLSLFILIHRLGIVKSTAITVFAGSLMVFLFEVGIFEVQPFYRSISLSLFSNNWPVINLLTNTDLLLIALLISLASMLTLISTFHIPINAKLGFGIAFVLLAVGFIHFGGLHFELISQVHSTITNPVVQKVFQKRATD